MTTAPCPTVTKVRDAGFLPRVILTSGRCRRTFLLMDSFLLPLALSLCLLPSQPALPQPPWGTLVHHLGMVCPAGHVQVRGVGASLWGGS